MILSDVCEFIVDCPHSTAPDEGEGYPLIRTPNVGKGRLDLNGVHRVGESVYKQRIQRGAPRANDLIFAREAPAGNVALVQENQTVCLGQRTVLIRPNVQKVNPQYLVYYLLSPKPQYELLGTANGATVAHVNLPAIRNLKIELPEKSVQDKIGTILVTYDDLIENNQKQIKLLEEAAQRLYKEWFVDLNFPGHENTKIVDGVPEGWIKEEIGKIIKKVHRTKQIVASEYRNEGSIPIVDQSRAFVAGYTNDLEARVDFGIPIIVFGDHTRIVKLIQFPFAKGADGTQLIISECLEMPQRLLYCSIMNVDLSNYHYARHFKYLKEEKIMIPTVKVANEFENNVTGIFSKIQNCRDEIIRCQKTRNLQLPKLMSGEVEV